MQSRPISGHVYPLPVSIPNASSHIYSRCSLASSHAQNYIKWAFLLSSLMLENRKKLNDWHAQFNNKLPQSSENKLCWFLKVRLLRQWWNFVPSFYRLWFQVKANFNMHRCNKCCIMHNIYLPSDQRNPSYLIVHFTYQSFFFISDIYFSIYCTQYIFISLPILPEFFFISDIHFTSPVKLSFPLQWVLLKRDFFFGDGSVARLGLITFWNQQKV